MFRRSGVLLFPVSIILIFVLTSSGLASEAEDQARINLLNQKIQQAVKRGRPADAVPLAEELLSLGRKYLNPGDPQLASLLFQLSGLHMQALQFEQAIPLLKEALAILEKNVGPEHIHIAALVNQMGEAYRNMGKYKEAAHYFKRALGILEKAKGPEDPDVAGVLNSIGLSYMESAQYELAENVFKRALAIREKQLGPNSPFVGQSLNSLADLYSRKGDLEKARELYQRALPILRKALGPYHMQVGAAYNGLGAIYVRMAEYKKAEEMFQKALTAYRKSFGPKHPQTALCMNNLGDVYSSMGRFSEAKKLFQSALTIKEKALGPEHPEVGVSLLTLAELYRKTGDYEQAEPLSQKALALLEKAHGPDHPLAASALINSAAIYLDTGDFLKAESNLKRGIAIREKILGPEHADVAQALGNLSIVYRSAGKYQECIEAFTRASKIWLKMDPLHPDLAGPAASLADLYRMAGKYDDALKYSQLAMNIREKIFPPDHVDLAFSLNSLAQIHLAMGSPDKAEPLFQRALDIFEKKLGPKHPHTASCLTELSFLHMARGDYKEAHEALARAMALDDELIELVLGFTSEDQKMRLLDAKKGRFYGMLTMVGQYLPDDMRAKQLTLDVWLRRKGIVLEAQKRFQEALFYADDPKLMEVFQELAEVRGRLSKLVFAGPGATGLEAYTANVKQLEKAKQRLEAKLSKMSRAYARKRKIDRADAAAVARGLPKKSVLIDFANYKTYNFKAKDWDSRWLPARYMVFVLPAQRVDQISMIDLGEAEVIDQAIAAFKKAVKNLDDEEGLQVAQASQKLFNLVFAPIIEKLGRAKSIFISPDGNLNLIPFEVLQQPDGRYLIEDYTFNYLSAGRDILGFGRTGRKPKSGKPVLIGDPLYNQNQMERSNALTRLGLHADEQPEEPATRAPEMRGITFSPLPGTREEVESIRQILGPKNADLYLGDEALEDVIRNIVNPRILHVATHGFFLTDQQFSRLIDLGNSKKKSTPAKTKPKSAWDLAQRDLVLDESDSKDSSASGARSAGIQDGSGPPGYNPLLRSGLAMAGANYALKAKDSSRTQGLLTAEKVLGLRLRGTDLVVLSACQTGLGDVKSGEGVFGLRRAFTQAGAKSIVMSMWPVPDEETKELMIEFYTNLKKKKMSRARALREAILKEMKLVRQRYGHTNPNLWGAFIFLGQP